MENKHSFETALKELRKGSIINRVGNNKYYYFDKVIMEKSSGVVAAFSVDDITASDWEISDKTYIVYYGRTDEDGRDDIFKGTEYKTRFTTQDDAYAFINKEFLKEEYKNGYFVKICVESNDTIMSTIYYYICYTYGGIDG